MTLVLTLHAQRRSGSTFRHSSPISLKDKSAKEIAAIDLATTKEAGEGWRYLQHSRWQCRCNPFRGRLRAVRQRRRSGHQRPRRVTGDAGSNLGRKLAGGEVIVKGHVGPYAGSGIESGRL